MLKTFLEETKKEEKLKLVILSVDKMDNYIESLKNDSTINRVKDENGNLYGIRVLGRGNNLFFQENDKALICEIDAVHSVIFTKTIKNWEGEKKMSVEEKKRVANLIQKYYKEVYNPDVKLLDINP